jgi:xylulose-5-phosphate/fructose-6-phosphate phosphoketolase
MKDEIQKHRTYAYTVGMDSPEINNWRWKFGAGSGCC